MCGVALREACAGAHRRVELRFVVDHRAQRDVQALGAEQHAGEAVLAAQAHRQFGDASRGVGRGPQREEEAQVRCLRRRATGLHGRWRRRRFVEPRQAKLFRPGLGALVHLFSREPFAPSVQSLQT